MNAIIKEVINLRKRAYREKTGLVIVEGYPEVRLAHQSGVFIRSLYICPELFCDEAGEFKDCPIVHVTREEFGQMAFGKRLKGIMAICRPRVLRFEDMEFMHVREVQFSALKLILSDKRKVRKMIDDYFICLEEKNKNT